MMDTGDGLQRLGYGREGRQVGGWIMAGQAKRRRGRVVGQVRVHRPVALPLVVVDGGGGRLKAVNASMGLMVEQVSPALLQHVHRSAPSKAPVSHAQTL